MTSNAASAAPTPAALDAPLPAELAGRAGSWLTAYRRYPVFSPGWVRGRLRPAAFGFALLALLLTYPLLSGPPDERPFGGVASLLLTVATPLLLGPWLGCQVRRRGWPPRQEAWGLAGAVALAVALPFGFEAFLAEPMKQWIAEQTGAVDETGQRKRVVLAIGVTVTAGARPASDAASAANDDAPMTPPTLRDEPLRWLIEQGARGATSFFLAGGLALFGWRRERAGLLALAQERALAEAESRRREAELRLSVLAAQVEPHFLFNTLAGVRSAIATDPPRAAEMIDRLVEYLRAAIPRLRGDASAQATVGAQFDIVRAYLGLMRARMPRLAVQVESPPELLAARCPPLMLISLAENAVKHGVELKVGPARIVVRAEREGQTLALIVEDDGVGFGGSATGSGLGLANIRERLAQLYGDRATLTLKARPDGGVAAILTLPLQITA